MRRRSKIIHNDFACRSLARLIDSRGGQVAAEDLNDGGRQIAEQLAARGYVAHRPGGRYELTSAGREKYVTQ